MTQPKKYSKLNPNSIEKLQKWKVIIISDLIQERAYQFIYSNKDKLDNYEKLTIFLKFYTISIELNRPENLFGFAQKKINEK